MEITSQQFWLAILAIISLYVCTRVYTYIKSWYKYLSFSASIQGPDYHWFWGHAFKHPGPCADGMKYDRESTLKYKTHYMFYFGRWRPNVFLVHPESIKQIVKTNYPKQIHGGAYGLLVPWLGYGLQVSNGSYWKRHRKLLTPAFHFDILKSYIPIFNKAVDGLISKWSSECDTGRSFDMTKSCTLMSLEIMLKCAFNYEDDSKTKTQMHEYARAVGFLNDEVYRRLYDFKIFPDIVYFNTPMGRKGKRTVDYVHNFADDIISKRKLKLTDNSQLSEPVTGKRFIDLLDIMLLARDEDNKGLTDYEIRSEVDSFLFAGNDSTKGAISWTLYALAENPDCQAKCYEEIRKLLDGKTNDYIELDDLNEIPYLSLCLKEGMRMYTTVPMTGRETSKPTNICGTEFPAGTLVILHLYQLHHNPYVWGDDHDKFKPERFLPENMKNMDPYAYLPFSGGPRNCIGQHFALNEAKIALIKILNNFEIVLDKENLAQPIPSLILVSSTGLNVYLKSRK